MWVYCKDQAQVVYLNLESAIRPVPHNDDDPPIPILPENVLQMSEENVFCEENTTVVEDTEVDTDFTIEKEDVPQKCSQGELNDLIRNLSLPKDKTELLASHYKKSVCLR